MGSQPAQSSLHSIPEAVGRQESDEQKSSPVKDSPTTMQRLQAAQTAPALPAPDASDEVPDELAWNPAEDWNRDINTPALLRVLPDHLRALIASYTWSKQFMIETLPSVGRQRFL